tara:strand:+ start:8121 stop:8852 length:732 start_codon:yes stop_codon:yes gene_type:complete
MEFKANFIGSLIVDAVYYGAHYFFFSIIFSYVDVLGAFSAADVKIFLVITFLGDTVYMMIFSGNLFNLNRLIISGDLDFALIRPVNGQFMVSFRYVKSYAIISLIILGLLLSKLISENSNDISIDNILLFLFSFLVGQSIWYSIDFMIGCLAFWFKNFTVGGWLSHEFLKFAERPDSIYTGLLRRTMFTILPMALLSSIPSRMLIYGPGWDFLFGQIFVAIIFVFLSKIVWKKGIKKYESASS